MVMVDGGVPRGVAAETVVVVMVVVAGSMVVMVVVEGLFNKLLMDACFIFEAEADFPPSLHIVKAMSPLEIFK